MSAFRLKIGRYTVHLHDGSVIVTTFDTLPNVERAHAEAQKRRIFETLGLSLGDEAKHELASVIAELVVLGAIGPSSIDAGLRERAAASHLLVKQDRPGGDNDEHLVWMLRASTLAVIADRPADAQRFLRAETTEVGAESSDWLEFVRQSTFAAWVSLFRQNGRADIDAASQIANDLRISQKQFESGWIRRQAPDVQRQSALELLGLYNLVSAADRMASYLISGRSEGASDINVQMDMQFERAIEAFDRSRSDLLDVSILLHAAARQSVANSLRTAVRGANTLAQRFADYLVGRKINPIFELLPPQRAALAEAGLMATARRSIVVNLPTSSGKTLIAEFSILQAISDLGTNIKGFVTYIAPTRALVNQVSAKLRQDFEPLGLRVERLSPALEFDSIEATILASGTEESGEPRVNVLVCTPEKFDLLMRRDDIAQTLGSLALVVVDEAHNLGASDNRAIKLELLLAMLNREHRDARFLLLTPFVKNAKDIATWLDETNYQDYSIAADWVPNDRIISLALPPEGQPQRGKFLESIRLKTLYTPRRTLFMTEPVTLPGVSHTLGLTEAVAKKQVNKLAVASAQVLSERGPTVLLCGKVAETWNAARALTDYFRDRGDQPTPARELASRFVQYELGDSFPLTDCILNGVCVHNSGLPEELAQYIEVLFADKELHTLCATTTLAQGVNFPISNLVLATLAQPYKAAMDYAEFWNIAGRVGRVDQQSVGVVALASSTPEQQKKNENYVLEALTDLASRLLQMAEDLYNERGTRSLKQLVFMPEWSSFAQFITHTFRRVGAQRFAEELELILRGTLGYKTLRERNTVLARHLLAQTQAYAQSFAKNMGAVKLVDSTGFSLESVQRAHIDMSSVKGAESLLDGNTLFSGKNETLRQVMGILLNIPEIREGLVFGRGSDGSKLAEMVSDWVRGRPIPELASDYFEGADDLERITGCIQQLKKISRSTSWGLASLIAIQFGSEIEQMSEEDKASVANVPSMALYGVNRSSAIALRSAGVPRNAALGLSTTTTLGQSRSIYQLRAQLKQDPSAWTKALGETRGKDYLTIWSRLEGV